VTILKPKNPLKNALYMVLFCFGQTFAFLFTLKNIISPHTHIYMHEFCLGGGFLGGVLKIAQIFQILKIKNNF